MIFKRIGRLIFWVIEVCGALLAAAGIVLLYVLELNWFSNGTLPAYDLQMLLADVHLQPPHIEGIGELILAGVLKIECWIVFLIVGGVLFILGAVGEGLLDDYVARKRATNAG
ncbi:MAG: hypothetical protein P4L50_00655 [Anaerolineaceae bacterium]|nr:hypothetical protein [Anaerolineaceae bacterium]